MARRTDAARCAGALVSPGRRPSADRCRHYLATQIKERKVLYPGAGGDLKNVTAFCDASDYVLLDHPNHGDPSPQSEAACLRLLHSPFATDALVKPVPAGPRVDIRSQVGRLSPEPARSLERLPPGMASSLVKQASAAWYRVFRANDKAVHYCCVTYDQAVQSDFLSIFRPAQAYNILFHKKSWLDDKIHVAYLFSRLALGGFIIGDLRPENLCGMAAIGQPLAASVLDALGLEDVSDRAFGPGGGWFDASSDVLRPNGTPVNIFRKVRDVPCAVMVGVLRARQNLAEVSACQGDRLGPAGKATTR